MSIAITTSGGLGAYLASRDNLTPGEIIGKALAGNESCSRKLAGEPDFVIDLVATTDTSDGEAVDLTDQGVTFPADSIRKIRGRSYCSSPNDHYWYDWEETVLGGTTPVLMGQKIIKGGGGDQAGTVFEYGEDLKFVATITALTTIDTILASKGYSLGDITSGLAALVVPRNRVFLPKGAVLTSPSQISATAAAADSVTFDITNLDGLGAGTGGVVFVNSNATTDSAASSPALGGVVALAFAVYPPINHRLVMDSNNVTVKCTATNANVADDSLRHRVEIWVDKLQQLAHTS